MNVQPYLLFDGRCEEAIAFYKKALGAEVSTLKRFKDGPPQQDGTMPPNSGDKIMHAHLKIGDSDVLASDGHCLGKANFQGFSLSLTAPTDADTERLFTALADGGTVHQPLIETFFATRFGMVADRFGVQWMLLTAM